MSDLKKLNEKLFYLFAGGLIVEILAGESLRLAFLYSIILGAILLILFSIYKLADYIELIETIKDWIEEFIDIVEYFFEEVSDWIKGVFEK